MIERRAVLGGLAAGMLAGCAPMRSFTPGGDEVLLFAYFGTGRGEALGLKFAVSDDGFAFRAIGGAESFLRPAVGESRLLRDPFLFRGQGPDAPFHLLWTTAWQGVTIGHAASTDLRAWSTQTALPVMGREPGTRNCWAPEAIWDARARAWRLFWSSTVSGRFPETDGSSESDYNHRLWTCTTPDFRTLSDPHVLFDPGFSVIDGTFARGPGGGLFLIVKDETRFPVRKHLQVASAASPAGPFGPLSEPFTPPWVEGPMTATINGRIVCYYDIYRDGRWGAAATRDFQRWEDVGSRLSMPPGARHGSLLPVPRRLVAALDSGAGRV